ncbi:MAG: hypothetical protein ACLR8L_06765 [Oscillospiraceae bacterium]
MARLRRVKTGTARNLPDAAQQGQGIYALGDTRNRARATASIILPGSVAALLRARKKASISQWIFPQPTSPGAADESGDRHTGG